MSLKENDIYQESVQEATQEEAESMPSAEENDSKPSAGDEIPSAYKDIDEVMENAKELVKIEHTLRQIINVKGD